MHEIFVVADEIGSHPPAAPLPSISLIPPVEPHLALTAAKPDVLDQNHAEIVRVAPFTATPLVNWTSRDAAINTCNMGRLEEHLRFPLIPATTSLCVAPDAKFGRSTRFTASPSFIV